MWKDLLKLGTCLTGLWVGKMAYKAGMTHIHPTEQIPTTKNAYLIANNIRAIQDTTQNIIVIFNGPDNPHKTPIQKAGYNYFKAEEYSLYEELADIHHTKTFAFGTNNPNETLKKKDIETIFSASASSKANRFLFIFSNHGNYSSTQHTTKIKLSNSADEADQSLTGKDLTRLINTYGRDSKASEIIMLGCENGRKLDNLGNAIKKPVRIFGFHGVSNPINSIQSIKQCISQSEGLPGFSDTAIELSVNSNKRPLVNLGVSLMWLGRVPDAHGEIYEHSDIKKNPYYFSFNDYLSKSINAISDHPEGMTTPHPIFHNLAAEYVEPNKELFQKVASTLKTLKNKKSDSGLPLLDKLSILTNMFLIDIAAITEIDQVKFPLSQRHKDKYLQKP